MIQQLNTGKGEKSTDFDSMKSESVAIIEKSCFFFFFFAKCILKSLALKRKK